MPPLNDEPVKAHLLTRIAIELALKNNAEPTNLRGLISAPGVSGADASMACQAFDDKQWTPDIGLLSDRRAGMSCPNGMKSFPLGPQLCGDQGVWRALLKRVVGGNVIRRWAAGKNQRVMNEDGFLDFASLSVHKYPTANTYLYGHHTNGAVVSKEAARSAGLIGVHMSKFGSWKISGMREVAP